jgi:hypothetical protein
MSKRTLFAAITVAVLAISGWAVVAHAYSCTTTCSGFGNFRTCNTYCW